MRNGKEKALDDLASAARGFGLMESWVSLDALRYFALRYAAAHVRDSNDNPDLASGGSVAAFLEEVAAPVAPRPVREHEEMTFPDPIAEDDCHMAKDEFLKAVEIGAFIDYDGFGNLATAKTKSRIVVVPSNADMIKWPEWATHVVWYNK